MNRHLKAWLAIAVLSAFMAAWYAALVWNGPIVMAVICVAAVVITGYAVTAK